MKSQVSLIGFGLLVVALIALFQTSECATFEMCPEENCVTKDMCEMETKGKSFLCRNKGTECCSVVKSEFRTHCRHHGGECMNGCNANLMRNTVDCSGTQVCCVLV